MSTNVVEILKFVKNKILTAFPEVLPENLTIGVDSDLLNLPNEAFPRIEMVCPIVKTTNYTDQYNIDSLLILGFTGYNKRSDPPLPEDIYAQVEFGMKLRAVIFDRNTDVTNAVLQFGVVRVETTQDLVFDYELINNVMGFDYVVPLLLNEPYLKE